MDKTEPLISFVVPIYNADKDLKQCIDSMCIQTYKKIEIILVDDGSTDLSLEICKKCADRDERIQVVHKENGGSVSARKAGIQLAKGDYILCVDSDDWIDADALRKLVDIQSHADMICFAAYEEYSAGEQGLKKNALKEGLYQGEKDLSRLYQSMLMNGNFFEMGVLPYQWGKLINRNLLAQCQNNVPDCISYAEDVACVYPCLLNSKSVYITNLPLYHYRIQPNSMMKKEVAIEKLQTLFMVLKNSFESHYMAESLRIQLKYYMWQSLLLKGYSHIENQMILFPFEKVKRGMNVAVYGAGVFGQIIESQCRSLNLPITGWFDKKYTSYEKQGLPVSSSKEVVNSEFDVLVIAILNSDLAKRIKEDYILQGIPEQKIDIVSIEVLDRVELPQFCQDVIDFKR